MVNWLELSFLHQHRKLEILTHAKDSQYLLSSGESLQGGKLQSSGSSGGRKREQWKRESSLVINSLDAFLRELFRKNS